MIDRRTVLKTITAIPLLAVAGGIGAAMLTGDTQRGDSVAVFGCGGVGDAAILGAKLAGASIIVAVDLDAFDGKGAGLDSLRTAFDAEHERLFSFLLSNEQELVTVRATVTGPRPDVATPSLALGGADASAARIGITPVWVDGGHVDASVFDRSLLLAGNVVEGPAVVVEMDSTTLVLPGHAATVHPSGSLLIRPVEG